MRLLDWLRPADPAIVDPDLGHLESRNGMWHGQIEFSGDTVQIYLGGNRNGPAESHRETLLRLRDRFNEIQDAVGVELLRLSEEHVRALGDDAGLEFPRPSTAPQALKVFILTAITIERPQRSILLYTYRDQGDDAMFDIVIDGEAVTGEYDGD